MAYDVSVLSEFPGETKVNIDATALSERSPVRPRTEQIGDTLASTTIQRQGGGVTELQRS